MEPDTGLRVIVEVEIDYLELLPFYLSLRADPCSIVRHFSLKSAAKICLCNAAWTNGMIGGIPGVLTATLATSDHVALVVPEELQHTCPVPAKILLRRKDVLINSANRLMNYAKLCVTSVATKCNSKRCVTV